MKSDDFGIGEIIAAISALSAVAGTGSSIASQVRGAPKAPHATTAPAGPAAMPQTAGAPTGAAPSTSPGDIKAAQESAYWKNLMASTGQGQPGGGLPEPLQQSIERQVMLG